MLTSYGSWNWYESNVKQWDRWCHWYHSTAPAPCLRAPQVWFSRKVSIHSSCPTPKHGSASCSSAVYTKEVVDFLRFITAIKRGKFFMARQINQKAVGLQCTFCPECKMSKYNSNSCSISLFSLCNANWEKHLLYNSDPEKNYVIKKYPCSWSTTKLFFSCTQQFDLPGRCTQHKLLSLL